MMKPTVVDRVQDANGTVVEETEQEEVVWAITADEAELCQLDVDEMYNIILQYQNDGIYGEDIVD